MAASGKGLVTFYGERGATKREGGGRKRFLAMLKRGETDNKFWGSIYAVA